MMNNAKKNGRETTANQKDKTRTSYTEMHASMAGEKKSKSWSQLVISGNGQKKHTHEKYSQFAFQWKEKTISLSFSFVFLLLVHSSVLLWSTKNGQQMNRTGSLINVDLIKVYISYYTKNAQTKIQFIHVDFVVMAMKVLSIQIGNIQVSAFNEPA